MLNSLKGLLNNLKISTKLVVILAAPLVVLIFLAGTGATQRRATAADSRADEQLTVLSRLDAGLAHQLNRELVLTVRAASQAAPEARAELDAQRKATDQAASQLTGELASFESSGTDAETRSAIDIVTRSVDTLAVIRKQFDDNTLVPVDLYHDAIEQVSSLQSPLVAQAEGGETTLQLEVLSNLVDYEANAAYAAVLLDPAVRSGTLPDATAVQAFVLASNEENLSRDVYLAIADPNEKNLLRNTVSGAEVEAVNQAARDLIGGRPVTANPGWDGAVLAKLDRINEVQTALSDQLYELAQVRSGNANRVANLFLILAIFGVTASLVLAFLVARAITGPIKRLTRSAKQLSQEHLPGMVESLKSPTGGDLGMVMASVSPIEVSGNDEVGQLAAAFNDVEKVAVEVATEQASLLRKGIGDMFVNLARRNQALLDRQIEFIDELETHEEDPDALEHLYHLDHLATRMRRNAESLLVLAGAEPNRRRGRPIALSDVVRAALGEVEDYARIELLQLDEVLVSSNAAADVAHLLSELMENASNFSPPDTKVEVVGHRTTSEGYVISVSDSGIGMSSEQMAEANETLARPPLVGLAMSRSLGFIVVGRLAARFGISVRLMSSPAGGVTAVAALPAAIVHETPGADGPVAAVAPPPAASPGENGGERWTPQVIQTPSDILPPLEFSFGPDDEAETLDEAVPGAAELDSELAALVAEEGDREDDGGDGDGAGPSLPTLAPVAMPPNSPDGGDARPSLFGPGPEEGPAHLAKGDLPESLPVGPEPVPVASHEDDDEVTGSGSEPAPATATLDGPAPTLASGEERPPAPVATPAPAPTPDPEEAPAASSAPLPPAPADATPQPATGGVRLFGAAASAAPAAGPGAPAPAAGVRLFGGGPEAPRTPDAAPADTPSTTGAGLPTRTRKAPVEQSTADQPRVAAPALSSRLFSAPPPDGGENGSGHEADGADGPAIAGPLPTTVREPAPATPAAPDGSVITTGLKKRTPRKASGDRTLPGWDGPDRKGVQATSRSPEEVRNLLSSYRGGISAGRTDDPGAEAPSGDPTPTQNGDTS